MFVWGTVGRGAAKMSDTSCMQLREKFTRFLTTLHGAVTLARSEVLPTFAILVRIIAVTVVFSGYR